MAQTTIIPFDSLPKCAKDCYKLYDVNGACVPPIKPAGDLGSYASCFCADSRVSPFADGTAGVCPEGTCATEQGGLESIRGWFTSFCAQNAQALPTTSTTAGGSSNIPVNQGPGGDWISMHWRWVIFIVVMVLGIVGIWVGACVWRRRYLRRKDRQYALGKSLARRSGSAGGPGPGASQRSVHLPRAGLFAPASISAANVYDIEKTTADAERANRRLSRPPKEKKKWAVTQRT